MSYYINKAGLQPQNISWNGTPIDIWNSVITEAISQRRVRELIEAALSRFQNDPFLNAALKDEVIDYSLAPDIDKELDWKGADEQTLEILTQQDINTLMPISFLEMGLMKAKSVAKVLIKRPASTEVGSGFLIDDNIFITNYHVISSKEDASIAKILFNYEDDIDGIPKKVRPFDLDAGKIVTSPVKGFDFAAIRIKGDANQEFGALKLRPPAIEVAKDQFVNIIQHPAGEAKKIALYHNIVTYADERKVQYLTDTLKGSSGSPVFNSQWELVALHHSGGSSKEYEEANKLTAFRNEGININPIFELIERGKKEGKL